MRDWSDEFPTLRSTTYLNSCASGLPSRTLRSRVTDWMQAWEDAPDWARWVEDVERARRAFADLIGADVDEVAVQQSVSTGLSAVASALHPQGDRDRIVATDVDFPTAPAIWRAQARRGFRVDLVRALPDVLPVERVTDAINERTRLVSVPHVASFTGQRLDVPAIVNAAHDAGALAFVDAFQSVGTTPVDVHAWDVDFLASGVYKWLCGTAGIAFLYVRRDLHAELEPTALGWYGLKDPYAFDPEDAPAPDARRFQYGGPSVLGAVAAEVGMGHVADVGVDAIARHNADLVAHVLNHVHARGWYTLTPDDPRERASIVTFRGPPVDASREALAREHVTVNERLGGFRVSPHFYNTHDDVDRLFDVLDEAVKRAA